MIRPRTGMAIVTAIAIVSLIAILAVATLSLTSGLQQRSVLALRDAQLDGAASYGLASVLLEWRSRSLGSSAVGATREFAVVVTGSPMVATAHVTRVSPEIFWAVVEARATDGSTRRENLILRRQMPNADSVVGEDSSNVTRLGRIAIDAIAGAADFILPAGASWVAGSGVVHARGDLTIEGGTGEGILIVEGRLAIVGPLEYSGLIIARGGIEASGGGATLTGSFRVSGGPPSIIGLTVIRSAIAVQDVMSKGLMPRPVAGRRWAELY
ncbi:MAG: hypothetical protein ABIR92_07420 [Gemmatimonadaceae bacterium]